MTTREDLEARIAPYWDERPVWRGLDVFDGWLDLIDRLVTDLEASGPVPRISQIKTKFGSLRFYASYHPDADAAARDAQRALIQKAEDDSLTTCEKCGAFAESHTIMRWMWTLCPECREVQEDEARRRTAIISE